MMWGKTKTEAEPETPKSEIIKQKLADLRQQIEGAEADLHKVSLDAALSEFDKIFGRLLRARSRWLRWGRSHWGNGPGETDRICNALGA